jgi:hypothetical protein
MSRQGKTVAIIARTCKMAKEDVKSILDEDEEEESMKDRDDGKLPSGASVGQCGCWGVVNPSMRQPHPACRSGYAQPWMCGGMCPGGGYAWRGVCT